LPDFFKFRNLPAGFFPAGLDYITQPQPGFPVDGITSPDKIGLGIINERENDHEQND
jgi:hypothetical protein